MSPTQEASTGWRAALPFVFALLIPLIGFVLGVIEAAKRSSARGAAIMAVSVFAAFAWYGALRAATAPKVSAPAAGQQVADPEVQRMIDEINRRAVDPEVQRMIDEINRRAAGR